MAAKPFIVGNTRAIPLLSDRPALAAVAGCPPATLARARADEPSLRALGFPHRVVMRRSAQAGVDGAMTHMCRLALDFHAHF